MTGKDYPSHLPNGTTIKLTRKTTTGKGLHASPFVIEGSYVVNGVVTEEGIYVPEVDIIIEPSKWTVDMPEIIVSHTWSIEEHEVPQTITGADGADDSDDVIQMLTKLFK